MFVLTFGSLALGFPALTQLNSLVVFAVFCFFLPACYGGIMAALPALTADEFGPLYIGRIYDLLGLTLVFILKRSHPKTDWRSG